MTDSAPGTMQHIRRVQELMAAAIERLHARAIHHDESKLEAPEKAYYDQYPADRPGVTYASPEYYAMLNKLQPALQRHYAHPDNSHHPEHHADGIQGMSLLDLLEMLADWKAASEAQFDGDLGKSLAINRKRFGIPPDLMAILENTRQEMGW